MAVSERLPALVEVGEGLLLRCWRPDDAPRLTAAVARNLDHLRPWMPWVASEPLSLHQRRALIEDWERDRQAGGDTVLGIFLDGRIAGGCGLHHRIGPGGLEIGYWVDVEHLRRGIATVVAARLTGVAFALRSIDQVEIHNDRGNAISGRIPAKLGYRLIAEVARAPVAAADTGVACHWRITREEWDRLGAQTPRGPASERRLHAH